jgi:hypothetical protein
MRDYCIARHQVSYSCHLDWPDIKALEYMQMNRQSLDWQSFFGLFHFPSLGC